MIQGGAIGQLTHSRPSCVNSFITLAAVFSLLGYFPSVLESSQPTKTQWIRADDGHALVWGVKSGVVFAVWPSGFGTEGVGGPRGLFRVGYERDGRTTLVNFIAVEPIIHGKRGFSELELSSVSQQDESAALRRGKFIWPYSKYPPSEAKNQANTVEDMQHLSIPGWFSYPLVGVEQLNVAFDVEKFSSGAHPWIVASVRSDTPQEVTFAVHAAPDSTPMDNCILTATMGNYIRARQLWLRDRIVYSKTLWPDPATAGVGSMGFTPPEFFEEGSMCRLRNGSLIVMLTTDEDDPSKIVPKPAHWHYQGCKVTQYWRVSPHREHPLRIRVNGRFTYWMSRSPIPNGVAYENFELMQNYFEGQQFVFGVTESSPTQFELTAELPQPP